MTDVATAEKNDSVSLSDSPLGSANDDTCSVVKQTGGTISVELSDDYLSHLDVLAHLREGTGSGMPASFRGFDSSELSSVQSSAMAGEGGLHVIYDEWELDERVIEDGGDGGIDGKLTINGELKTVDVKTPTSQYSGAPWLKVRVSKIRNEIREHGEPAADVFVLASYDSGTVRYHGWISSDELCTESYRSRRTGIDNYLVRNINELNPMPQPNAQNGCVFLPKSL